MSHFLDRLSYLTRERETYADGHGSVTREDRTWEESYRRRCQHDKIVRSTHGTNCAGSCGWKIYVKGGIVTWDDPAYRLSAYPSGPAQPPSARPLARRLVFPVHVRRQPREMELFRFWFV